MTEQQKLFAVAHDPSATKPYIVRTATTTYMHSCKSGADRTIMALIKAGYKLDQTGQTSARQAAARDGGRG